MSRQRPRPVSTNDVGPTDTHITDEWHQDLGSICSGSEFKAFLASRIQSLDIWGQCPWWGRWESPPLLLSSPSAHIQEAGGARWEWQGEGETGVHLCSQYTQVPGLSLLLPVLSSVIWPLHVCNFTKYKLCIPDFFHRWILQEISQETSLCTIPLSAAAR